MKENSDNHTRNDIFAEGMRQVRVVEDLLGLDEEDFLAGAAKTGFSPGELVELAMRICSENEASRIIDMCATYRERLAEAVAAAISDEADQKIKIRELLKRPFMSPIQVF